MNRVSNNKQTDKRLIRARMEMVFGLVFGLLTPVFAVIMVTEVYPKLPDVRDIDPATWEYLTTPIITFAIIVNAGVFFLALKMKREHLAKGVLFACILAAAFMLIAKFAI